VLVCARLDLTTAMELDRRAAVVVETGSSAAAPLRAAQSRGIPVVRLRDAISLISEGTIVAVDGTLGQVEIAA
jgi:phosphohistidine swiveling domain-containing protein